MKIIEKGRERGKGERKERGRERKKKGGRE